MQAFRVRTTFAALAIAGAAALASPAGALAAPCNVTNGATLDAALANNACDPINLAAGTYLAPDDFDLNRAVTLQGAGAGSTVLDAPPGNSTVDAGAGGTFTATLNDLSLSGGTNGLYINLGTPTINLNRVVVSGNSPGAGISVSSNMATVTVTDSTVRANTGSGGISNFGTLTLTNVTLENNTTTGNGGGLTNATTGATATLNNVTVAGNRADLAGGGISAVASTTTNINNTTITGNVGDDNSNAVDASAGGLNYNGTVKIRNSIISGNVDEGPTPANRAPDCGPAPASAGLLTRLGYLLVANPTNCTFGGPGDTTLGYQSAVDPLLGALANNGGPTQTIALPPTSPAVDKIPAGSCVTATDQRGTPRPQSGLCDLGAFELVPPPPPTFNNTTSILLPAGQPGTSTGPGDLYPSQVSVAGLQGTVTGITVRLMGLTHTFPGDVEGVLVGPQGQNVELIGDTGAGTDVTGVTLTFSDGAASSLPSAGVLTSGTYKPTNIASLDSDLLPPPAPAEPYGTALAAFNGTSPNGIWKLFMRDDAGGDFGILTGGWGLEIQTTGPPATPQPIVNPVPLPKPVTKCKKPKKKSKKAGAAAKCKKKPKKK